MEKIRGIKEYRHSFQLGPGRQMLKRSQFLSAGLVASGRDVEFKVPVIGGGFHRLKFVNGSLIVLDHDKLEADGERVICIMGGDTCPCIDCFEAFRKAAKSRRTSLRWSSESLQPFKPDPSGRFEGSAFTRVMITSTQLYGAVNSNRTYRVLRKWRQKRWPDRKKDAFYRIVAPDQDAEVRRLLDLLAWELSKRHLCSPHFLTRPPEGDNKIFFTFPWTEPHIANNPDTCQFRLGWKNGIEIALADSSNGTIDQLSFPMHPDKPYHPDKHYLTWTNDSWRRKHLHPYFNIPLIADWICLAALSSMVNLE